MQMWLGMGAPGSLQVMSQDNAVIAPNPAKEQAAFPASSQRLGRPFQTLPPLSEVR